MPFFGSSKRKQQFRKEASKHSLQKRELGLQASQSTLSEGLTAKTKRGVLQNHKCPNLQQAKIDSIQ